MCSEVTCTQVAARHGLCHLDPKSMSLGEILRSHMEEPATLFTERCAASHTLATALKCLGDAACRSMYQNSPCACSVAG